MPLFQKKAPTDPLAWCAEFSDEELTAFLQATESWWANANILYETHKRVLLAAVECLKGFGMTTFLKLLTMDDDERVQFITAQFAASSQYARVLDLWSRTFGRYAPEVS